MSKMDENTLIKAFRLAPVFVVAWVDPSGQPCYYLKGGYLPVENLLKAVNERMTVDFKEELEAL